MHSPLVVLGGGPGGYPAAFLAADLGMEVIMIEQEPRLGGTCLLRGCIPSKALLHVAKVIDEAQHLGDEWGVTLGKAQINLDALRARKEKVISTLTGGLKSLAKQRKVRIINARGVFENSTTLRLEGGDPATYPEGSTLTFDKCVLATGSVPAKIPAFDLPTDRVMDSTGALELRDIPETLLVIGGGYIGLEMGSVYAQLGSKVTVVELTDTLLPGADRDLVKPLQARLQKQFANIYLGTKVAGLVDKGSHIEVTFETPEGKRQESFSRVMVTVGRKPTSAGFGLEKTKVKIDQRGFVQVDKQLRTADEHIWAIGDVAGEPMLAHKASHEGRVAVEVIHGEPVQFDALVIPAVVFTDPEVAWVGLTESQAAKEGRKVEISRYPWAASGKAIALARTEGMTKIIIDPETDRVLGVGIVGVNAGDLIAEAGLAIEMGCDARDLAQTIHAHPTLSETIAFGSEAYFGTATEIYRPKRD
ncbi:MAG: dihydrolipoyl dehydrogenase [Planctomycetes bacterium]|nr:dihydrolipoyl dehydrogenase [Planctomycetota bacterium]